MEQNKQTADKLDTFSDEYLLEDTDVASTLNLYRRLQGISLVELSERTEVDIETLSHIEKGIIKPIDTIKLICHHIHIPFNVLIINAMLIEDDYQEENLRHLAKLLQPLIHQLTKHFFVKPKPHFENINLSTN